MRKADYLFERNGFSKRETESYIFYTNFDTGYGVEINKSEKILVLTENGEVTNRLPKLILYLIFEKYAELGWIETKN